MWHEGLLWYYNGISIGRKWKKGNLNEWETGMELKEKKRIKISVRNLVEFVMKSGDIDNRRTAGADREAMQAGSRIHRDRKSTRLNSSHR